MVGTGRSGHKVFKSAEVATSVNIEKKLGMLTFFFGQQLKNLLAAVIVRQRSRLEIKIHHIFFGLNGKFDRLEHIQFLGHGALLFIAAQKMATHVNNINR